MSVAGHRALLLGSHHLVRCSGDKRQSSGGSSSGRSNSSAPSDNPMTSRRRVIGATGGALLVAGAGAPLPATAYGLSKAPPPPSNQRSYADIQRAREDAERRREEKEAEANPGELVTLPSGIQYRVLDTGKEDGKVAAKGDTLFILYKVYRLAPGAYFKYSSGGTPIFLWSRGYGDEGQDDVGSTYKFVLGEANSLPRAVPPAVLGMHEGGKRRVLVPPQVGWTDGNVKPRPETFGAGRRLENHREEPLLMEVDLVRIRKSDEPVSEEELMRDNELLGNQGNFRFTLPAPPSPFKNKLGEVSQ